MIIFGMPFLNWFLFFFVYIPIVILWVSVIVDIFRRKDMSGGAKFLWVVLEFIVPLFGSLIYILARPSEEEMEMEKQHKRAA
jgi:predicted membrane channel-forming protein YqfA (hemolysin III family)